MTSDNLFAVPIFCRGLFPFSLLILVTAAVCSGADLEIVASDEPDWPQFRGPRRDGVCDETGLLGSWPEGGPALVWKIDRVGRGYSSPIIVEDTLYITGDVGEDHFVFALNLDGTLKWKTTNGRFWEKPWGGARTSCTYDDGRLYQMNARGRVVCLDPNDGKEIWSVNILERFGAKNITWAISECLVIDRDRLIVTPGGPKTFMAALDKVSGETVWTTDPIRFTRTIKPGNKPVDSPHKDTDKPGYALDEKGTMTLLRLGSESFEIVGKFEVPKGSLSDERQRDVWTHPVIHRARLYLRNHDLLLCYDIKAPPE